MNINCDGTIVTFKTEPEDLFEAEKSGAKPNTVRILDYKEYQQLKKADPKKISILHHREIILRTITHIYATEVILGKVIVVFSWTHEKHHHAMHSETNHRPGDYNISIDEKEPLIGGKGVNVMISKNLFRSLQSIAHGRSMNSIIQETYEAYLYREHEAKPAKGSTQDMRLDPAELCRRIDTSQRAILLPGALIQQLQDADLLSSLPAFISKLLEEHRIKRAEERGPIEPQSNLRLPVPLIHDLIGLSGNDTVPRFLSKLLEQYRNKRAEERGPRALYRLDQDNEDKLIATIKLLKCPDCDATGSILLLKTREGDKASKYGKCYKCGTEYRLDQRGNFYHG